MDDKCSICLQDIINRDTCVTQCSHQFCIDCLDRWFDRGENSCPMCRQAIQYITHNNETKRIIFNRLNMDRNIRSIRDNPITRSMIDDNVLISRPLYRFMIGSYFILTTMIILPTMLYYDINEDYKNISKAYIECYEGGY